MGFAQNAEQTVDYQNALKQAARGTYVEDKANTAAVNLQNRPNTSSAFGGQTWLTDPDNPNITVLKQSFSGPLKGANKSLQDQYAQALGTPIDGSAAGQDAFDAAYNQSASRLDPQWDMRQNAMDTQLLNSGLDPSSEAAQNANINFSNQRNDAYTNAFSNAQNQGMAANDAYVQSQLAARAGGGSQLEAMLQLLRQPDFVRAQKVAPTQYLRAMEDSGNVDNANADQINQALSGGFNGGTQLAGSIVSLANS